MSEVHFLQQQSKTLYTVCVSFSLGSWIGGGALQISLHFCVFLNIQQKEELERGGVGGS